MATMELPEALPNSPTIDYLVWLSEYIYFHPRSLIAKSLRIKQISDISNLVKAINNRHTFIIKRIVYFIEFISFLQRSYYTDAIIFPSNYNIFKNYSKKRGISIEEEVNVLKDWRNPSYFMEDPFNEREIVKAYISILYKVARIEIDIEKEFEINWVKQNYEDLEP